MGTWCFWCRPQKYKTINDKYEAPQGQPSSGGLLGNLPEISGWLPDTCGGLRIVSGKPLGSLRQGARKPTGLPVALGTPPASLPEAPQKLRTLPATFRSIRTASSRTLAKTSVSLYGLGDGRGWWVSRRMAGVVGSSALALSRLPPLNAAIAFTATFESFGTEDTSS